MKRSSQASLRTAEVSATYSASAVDRVSDDCLAPGRHREITIKRYNARKATAVGKVASLGCAAIDAGEW